MWTHKKFRGKEFKGSYHKVKGKKIKEHRVLYLLHKSKHPLVEVFESHEKAKQAGWKYVKNKRTKSR